jgi:tetratricopeptide (TPR) repeat protein
VASVRGRQAERPAAGACLGDYELLAEIGSGGMGVVYKARQRQLNRLVALKAISAGCFASAELVQRFRNEAEAAAALDHPHIVPVYEVGQWRAEGAGQPVLFFSMKLIVGGSLANVCNGPSSALSPHQAARLLIAIARAVHHAHQRGILHRDLKPSNILLDTAGQPYVADFGLAKRLTGDSELTHSGTLLGTPSYMAPELGAPNPRAATTAADVYGLGAILYALLTGQPPFKGETPLDTLALVRAGDPHPPHRHNPVVNRDLEAICLKCMEREPGDRYPSAEALADDLERFLADRPIQARHPSLAQRLTKLARRHRGLVWALFGGLLVAVTVLGISTGIIWREKQQAEQAYRAEAEARTAEAEQRLLAEANELQARQVVDEMYTKVAEEWLATEPRMQLVQRDLLLKALHFYEKLLRSHPTDPQIRFKTAQAYHFVGRVQHRLGQTQESQQAIRQQIALLRDLVAEVPATARYRFDLFHSLRELAIAQAGSHQIDENEILHNEAYDLIAQLVREFPDEPDYQDSLANESSVLGSILAGQGNSDEAERAFRTALALAEDLTRRYPNKRTPPHYPANVAHNLYQLAELAYVSGRASEAEQLSREALRVQIKLARDVPEEPNYRLLLGGYRLTLAMHLMEAGQLAEAKDLLDQALVSAEEAARLYPHLPRWPLGVALARTSRGHFFLREGDESRAAEEYRAARAAYEKLIADFPRQADLKSRFAYFLADCPLPRLRDAPRAIELLAQAAPAFADPITHGMVYYRAGDWAASARHLEKALQQRKAYSISAWFFMAMVCWQQGAKERARQCFREAAAWMDKHLPQNADLRRHRAEAAALLGIEDQVTMKAPAKKQ